MRISNHSIRMAMITRMWSKIEMKYSLIHISRLSYISTAGSKYMSCSHSISRANMKIFHGILIMNIRLGLIAIKNNHIDMHSILTHSITSDNVNVIKCDNLSVRINHNQKPLLLIGQDESTYH